MGRKASIRGSVRHLMSTVVLALLWVMYWDSVSGAIVLSGLVIGLVVTRIFYLPPIELSGRVNFRYVFMFTGWVLVKIAIASVHVAVLTWRIRPVSAGSVIAVEMNTRSDLLLTQCSIVSGLIPGSIVIEIDRARSILYIHALNCADDEEIEAVRAQTHRIEHFLIAAIGSVHDLYTLNEWRVSRGLKPVVKRSSMDEMRRRKARL